MNVINQNCNTNCNVRTGMGNVRKRGYLLLLISIAVVFSTSSPAQTAALPSTIIYIADVSAPPNGSITAPIMVNHVTNLGSGTIDVTYNPEIVHVADVASGTGNSLMVQSRNINNTIGLVRIVALDANAPHSGNVIFANVTYKAVASTGSTPLNITVRNLEDYYNYTQIPHTITNGTFTIPAQPTPFLIYGYVFYGNDTYSACNGPVVNITNLNTGEKWQAETNTAYNYYQLVFADGIDVNVGEILRFDATSPDGNKSNTTNHTVTLEEINNGGIFNFNITLKPNIFDTGGGTYPSIMGVHRGNFIPKRNITIHQMYTYPCKGTGGHSEYVAFYDENGEEIANASWKGYQEGDYQNIRFEFPFILHHGVVYSYEIRTGSYPQIIHHPSYENDYGIMTCTGFTDANGRGHNDWIPAIRLE